MVIYNVQSNGSCNQLVIELINDSIFVEPNMVAYVTGNVIFDTKSSLNNGIKSFLVGKRFFKPKFQGTGKIFLRATLGSYHKFALKNDEELVLAPNVFVACRDAVKIVPQTKYSLGNFLSGTPMLNMLVKGTGNVMVLMPGPVQEFPLKEEKFVAFGSEIAAYSPQLNVTRQIAGKDWITDQKMVRVFRGTGSVFFSPIPNNGAR